MQHPRITPSAAPVVLANFARFDARCAAVISTMGNPNFEASASTVPPKHTPDTSEKIWPHAAAVRVDSPKVTPIVASIISPAWIMTKLSIIPNPTMGTAEVKAICRSCRPESSSADTAAVAATAEPPRSEDDTTPRDAPAKSVVTGGTDIVVVHRCWRMCRADEGWALITRRPRRNVPAGHCLMKRAPLVGGRRSLTEPPRAARDMH